MIVGTDDISKNVLSIIASYLHILLKRQQREE